MIKRITSLITALIMTSSAKLPSSDEPSGNIPSGWLIYHAYSDYFAMDSKLYLRFPDGSVNEITGDFKHAMNGSFGSTPCDAVFMAIDEKADEWDIFRVDTITGNVVNLTEKSGFRNEDPKFSPDGSKIVFKRGHWDSSADGFIYNLSELDLASRDIRMLTDDTAEEAMPCYSADGRSVYYASYTDGHGTICRLDLDTLASETIYDEEGVTAYYPIVRDDALFFTKQVSSENKNDVIMRYDGDSFTELPFCSPEHNFSDPCPIGSSAVVFSSTLEGSYDLFCYDGSGIFPVDGADSDKNELGADFYPLSQFESYIRCLHDHIMGRDTPLLDYDINGDGTVNCFDSIYAGKIISSYLS